MIETFLVLSVLVNILFVLYSRWLISILRSREEDVNALADVVATYVSHVKAVHQMEMFYGDKTLQTLIEHGTEMVEKIEDFDFILNDTDSDVQEAPEQ